MQRNGRKRIFELLDDEKLCRAMLDIFNKITPSKSQLTFQSFPFLYNQNYNPDKQQARPHP
jgi:hypothetical protein